MARIVYIGVSESSRRGRREDAGGSGKKRNRRRKKRISREVVTKFTFFRLNTQENFFIPKESLSSASGYAQTKWVSERLLTSVQARGLPVTIFRIGMVGSSEDSGFCNKTDFVARFMVGVAQLGCMPDTGTFFSR
jgi:nucleoside-diphosphate-sugar epimerase